MDEFKAFGGNAEFTIDVTDANNNSETVGNYKWSPSWGTIDEEATIQCNQQWMTVGCFIQFKNESGASVDSYDVQNLYFVNGQGYMLKYSASGKTLTFDLKR